MEPDGHAEIVGHGAAYFLTASPKNLTVKEGKPLSIGNTSVKKVPHGGKFDLHSWSGDSIDYQLHVNAGKITSTQQNGAVY